MKIFCTFLAIVTVVGLSTSLIQYILPADWRWMSEDSATGAMAISFVSGFIFFLCTRDE